MRITKQTVKSAMTIKQPPIRGEVIERSVQIDEIAICEKTGLSPEIVRERLYANMIKWGWIYDNGRYCIAAGFPF